MSADYRVEPADDQLWRQLADATYRTSNFTAKLEQTLDLLGTELRHLTGREECVLHMTVDQAMLTVTGKLRKVPTTTPGVRLTCTTKDGEPFEITCAKWWGWENNLRAIALTLEVLRAADRWGASEGRQMRGFLALPPGGGYELGQTTGMDRDTALRVVLERAGWLAAGAPLPEPSSLHLSDAYQSARRKAHPDRHQGDDGPWNHLTYAGRVLGLEH